MRIYPWGKFPACLFHQVRELEAYATEQNPEIVAQIDAIAKREHTEIRRGGRLPDATVDAGRDRTVALGREPKKGRPKRKPAPGN